MVALAPQEGALLDAEAMLLVDDRDTEAGELRVAVEERVGADEDVDLPRLQPGRDAAAFGRGRAVRQERDADGPVGEQRTGCRHGESLEQAQRAEVVLLGEHFGGCHERTLVAALDRDEQGRERNHGLARTDVALQQPVHRRGAREVVLDLGEGALLVAGEGERQPLDECAYERPVDLVTDARLLGFERALAGDETDLHAQELVEDEPALGRVQLAHRLGAVDGAQRGAAVEEVARVEERLVERIGEAARRGTSRARPTPARGAAR